jgi:hypothetical protein
MDVDVVWCGVVWWSGARALRAEQSRQVRVREQVHTGCVKGKEETARVSECVSA